MQYARNCDRRDESGFGGLFAEQAVLEGENFRFATPAEIRNVPNLLRRYAKTYHTLLNYSVDVSGDQADGEAYSMAHHLTARADGKYDDLVMYITYRDRYVRRGADWLFEHRRVLMEFTEQRIVDNVGSMPKPTVT
jgi:SnoaL-like domain